MSKRWVPRQKRQEVLAFVQHWAGKTRVTQTQMLRKLGLPSSKYYAWVPRDAEENRHNAPIPKQTWLQEDEKEAILEYHDKHPDEGYRRLTYMMLDANIAAASPSSVYRVLKSAGRLQKWAKTPSKKGTGFRQPSKVHQHWHIDISYLNLGGTFYYLCSILDGYSRYLIYWEIRAQMTEADVEMILLKAKESFPEARPRLISDNGPQFVARDFKAFIRFNGMTHVRTAPYYPQSNGKKERWFGTLKQECIRPKTPLDLADARQVVAAYVTHYNEHRLHSALGYITPQDKLAGHEQRIFAERKVKLREARKKRRAPHQNVSASSDPSQLTGPTTGQTSV